jgi:integrase
MADKLTNDLIEAVPAPAKGAITRWDNDPKARGFGVRIFAPTQQNPAGVRSFFINYRIDGTERRHTIGKYPTWSASAARAEAQDLRKRIDRGEDPANEKRERREAPTVRDLVDRYIKDHLPNKAAAEKAPRLNDEHRMLDLIGESLDWRRKVAEIHFGDIEAMHRQITEDRGPVRANRVLSIASKVFSLSLKPLAGENKPWRDAAAGNPCKGVSRNPEEGRERFFSEAEIAALSDALNEHITGSAADCIRFIMLTGCRPGEAMQATWDQMDVEPGYWVKRSAHTKQRKVHKVPLSPPALALLAKLREARKDRANNPHVFPGQNPGESLKQIWGIWYAARDRATIALWVSGSAEIAKMMAELQVGLRRSPTLEECQALASQRGITLPAGLIGTRPYDLRHTFASVGAGGGLSLPIIGKLLGHTQARTTQRYAHLADDPLKEATKTIGAVISGAGQPTAKILPIKG